MKDALSLSGIYSFTSIATRYERLLWKLKGMGMSVSRYWKLLNAEGLLLTTWRERINSAGGGKSKGVAEPEMAFLDVIMMTGIAVLEMKRLEEEIEGEVVGGIISPVVGA
jgi:hypothetical protein